MENETMELTQEAGFDDFLEADGADAGYQTGESQDATETEGTAATMEAAEGSGGDSSPEGDDTAEADDKATEEAREPDKADGEQTFTIKVNKEERTVSQEEMVALAQKGSDYDRVKGQLAEARQTAQTLQEQIDGQKEIMSLLELVSERSGMPRDKLVEQLYINVQKSRGVEEAAAKESLRADRLQKKLSEMEQERTREKTSQEASADRAKREIAEFREQFPDVEITKELVDSLMEDVQKGMTMASAYRKAEGEKKDAQITQLRAQLAAEKQNKKNRSTSPGSQKDLGGQTKKDSFDEFMEAFN